MKGKSIFLVMLPLSIAINSFAQFGGNQVYRDRDNNRRSYRSSASDNRSNALDITCMNDSTVTFNVSVLLNRHAAKFLLTLGLNQEGNTPKDCLTEINKRIAGFTDKIKDLGIKKDNVFVDFISQTKIYDFDTKSNQGEATQVEKGFEVKKNIIIKTADYADIEKIIAIASDFQIYNIVNVDYLNDSIEAIRNQLVSEAYDILNRKKEDYFGKFNRKIIGAPYTDIFFDYVFPQNQYHTYQAFESSDFNRYSSNTQILLMRKDKTFYYDGIDYSGFDKVINNADPVVGIQYVLTLKTTFDVQKNK